MTKPTGYHRGFGSKYSYFGSDTKGHDLKAFGDTTGKYIFWDASADTFYIVGTLSLDGTFSADNIALIDAETLTFGTGSDVVMQWDGTNFIIAAAADDSLIEIGDSATSQKSFDLKWYANEASGASYLYFDASDNLIYTTGVDLQFKDNDVLVFGTGAGATGDIGITYDANSLNITPTAASDALEMGASGHVLNTTLIGTLTVGVNDTGYDVKLYGATAGVYLLWDESEDTLALVGKYTQGVSGTPVVNDTANVKFFQQYVDCGATSGESIGAYLRHYTTGAGGSGIALRAFETVSDILAVDARGAHISLSFASTGKISGSGQALTTTLHIANQATQSGTLSAITTEINSDGTDSDPAGSTLSCIRMSQMGSAKDDVDDDCAAIHFDAGWTVGDANMIAIDNSPTTCPNITHSVRLRLPDGSAAYMYLGATPVTA